jgi:hypothetical protein
MQLLNTHARWSILYTFTIFQRAIHLQKMSVSSGPSLQDDFSNIPLADDDPQGINIYAYL